MCRMELIPRTGIYTPIIPVGMAPAQLIMDMAPTKHPVAMLELLRKCLHSEYNDRHLENLSKAASTNHSEPILITAIHHVELSLPPHVCFDLFLSRSVTVKDEGPCGWAGTVPWKPAPGPSTELRSKATAPALSSMLGLRNSV
ncbi:Cysteine synthase [Dissostichus eleginoides]|uniref:Cysteine synthase n=1 Tax=Dissostichus eleginoides TaxID=100907 RepID=A0AAD9BYF3_DISEL|nr:Cysteine synthase [Dissostichus eleginoides]